MHVVRAGPPEAGFTPGARKREPAAKVGDDGLDIHGSNGFWDRLGPPAPMHYYLARMPEVIGGGAARRCALGSCSISQSLLPVSLSQPVWSLSAKMRNRLAHAITGNSVKGTSKGKGAAGKGKVGKSKTGQQTAQESDQNDLFLHDIRDALPDAARIRMLPQLVQNEWSAIIKLPHDLNHQGGIAAVQKADIPMVLRNVGYTREPTAILVTQHPAQVGMRGYDAQSVRCTFRVREDDGSLKALIVTRFLVQLGFGAPVCQQAEGELVSVPTCMHRVNLKMPACYGWTPEMVTGSTVARLLEKHIPPGSYDAIVCRDSLTATCLIHFDVLDKALEASGRDSLFIKMHPDESVRPPFELLWLDDSVELEAAVEMAKADHVFGVVAKNTSKAPRLALRFAATSKLQEYAKRHGIFDYSRYGRWKLSGLPLSAGVVGAAALLQQRGWKVQEVLYFGDKHCVFVAEGIGKSGPMFYEFGGTHRQQLLFTALNAVAKELQQQAAQQARASTPTPAAPQPHPARQRATQWQLQAAQAMQAAPPATPRGEGDAKRVNPGPTGNSPDTHKQRHS